MFIFSFIICNFSGKNELPYIRLSVWRKVPREKSISGESRPVSSWVSGAGAMQAEAASPYLESNEGHVEAGAVSHQHREARADEPWCRLTRRRKRRNRRRWKSGRKGDKKLVLFLSVFARTNCSFVFLLLKLFLTIVLTCFIPKTNGKRACTFRQVCLSSCLRCTS